jgi:hypothetical protein
MEVAAVALSFDSLRQIDYPQRHNGVKGKAKIEGWPAAQGKVRAKARAQVHAKSRQGKSQAQKGGGKKSGQHSRQTEAISCEGFRQVSPGREGPQGRSQVFV